MADINPTASELAEKLLSAMQIISQSNLNDISFDKTEICTILSKENDGINNNCYFVSNGSIKFKAYVPQSADGTIQKYKKDDSVRVSIPNGDYTKKKIIEGLSVNEDNDNPTIFVSPLETMLDITDSIIPEAEANIQYGLIANGEKEEYCLWSADFDNNAQYRDVQNSDICDTIALKADFKTLFSNYNIVKGHYGLRLDLYFHTADNDGDTISNVHQHSVYLDSSDMFGNPYSFLISSTQAIKFSIKDLGRLKGANLYFYQKKDFYYLDDKGIKNSVPEMLEDNILVKNLYISFGSNIINMDNNTFKIYCNDSRQYNQDNNVTTESIDDYKEFGLLWFNKDDNGKYLGFSDGIYDPEYDEIKYINESAADSRLLAQKGRNCPSDFAGLLLSANLEDEQKLYSEIYNLISKDLYNDLKAFQSRLQPLLVDNNIKTAFDNILVDNKEDKNKSLNEFLADYEDKQKKLVKQYTSVLAFAKQRQNAQILGEEKPTIPKDLEDTMDNADAIENICNVILSWIERINPNNLSNELNLFKPISERISKNYGSFQSIYDSFVYRFELIYNKIKNRIEKIRELVDKNSDINKKTDKEYLSLYLSPADYPFEEYGSTIKEEDYENRYCVYWYRYQPNAPILDDEPRFLDKRWKRITSNEKVNGRNITNLGVPEKFFLGEDGKNYNDKRDTDEILGINLDTTIKSEKIKAILFYNHTMYESNEIEFINKYPYTEQQAADQHGALYLEHSENSRDTYQSYGVNNCLINAADIYKTRFIKVRFDGQQGKDEYLDDAQVFWYLPKDSTMLTYDLNDYDINFTNDINSSIVSENSIDGYYCFYKTIIKDNDESRLFPYRIKDYYSPSFSQNEIICKVKPKNSNHTYEANILFTFSSYGTSGTDYTLVVSPIDFKSAVDVTIKDELNYNLVLKATLYDYKNKVISLPETRLECEWVGGDAVSPYVAHIEGDKIYIKIDQVLKDGKLVNDTDNMQYYGVLKTSINFSIPSENNVEKKSRTVKLTTINVIPFKNGEYYIEGPSIVVYDSSGTNASYYKDPFKIFNNENKKEIVNDNDNKVSWSIEYYNEEGQFIDKANPSDDYKLLYNFMPKLGGKNELIPCTMYLDDTYGTTKLYPIVLCRYNDNLIWAQPIYLMQNRYPSAMLNAWDGSFQIDEENGTIMSTMMGAGRKNIDNQFEGILMGDIQGTSGGDISADTIGLYGYNDGAQSFGFKIDGTAFLGKSGYGRIVFNGNEGIIKSASYDKGTGMLINLTHNIIDAKNCFTLTAGQKNTESHLALYSQDQTSNTSINNHSDNTWRIIAGSKFGITKAGDLYASNVNLTGIINASVGGTIGPFTIGERTVENETYGYLNTNSHTIGNNSFSGVYLGLDGLSLLGDKGKVFFEIDIKKNSIVSKGLSLQNFNKSNEEVFSVSQEGYLKSISGEIAGWRIKSQMIDRGSWTPTDWSKDDKTYLSFLASSPIEAYSPFYGITKYWLLYLYGGKFGVTGTGDLYAHNANITGIINATEGGHIGKWKIDASGNLKSDSGLVTLNGSTGKIEGSEITGGKIFGTEILASSISSNSDKGSVSITNDGILTAKGANIEGTLSAGSVMSSGIIFEGEQKIIMESFQSGIRLCSQDKYSYFAIGDDGLALYCNGAASDFMIMTQDDSYPIRINASHGKLQGMWYGAFAGPSDKKIKNTINIFSDKYEKFFDNLIGYTFKFNDGTSNRTHSGFIAQQVKEAMDLSNISSLDFAGLVIKNNKDGTEDWYLRYEEFISLNTWQIQKLKSRVTNLENEIQRLKGEKGLW